MAPKPTKAALTAELLPVKYHYQIHVGKAYNLITHRDRANMSHMMEPDVLDTREKIK